MSGLATRLPAPELPDSPRSALVVATTTYGDPTLSALRAPSTDADELGKVLATPELGGFKVTKVIDDSSHGIRVAIDKFLNARTTNEFVLVYLSCHGLTDKRRRLHFAASDTVRAHLASTAVSSLWVNERLEECRARRQLLILDCCFSGAFAHGGKGVEAPALETLADPGRGRVTLTASDANEYSYESATSEAAAELAPASRSLFTAALVKGLSTGSADADGDGLITISEAFEYARQELRTLGAAQTPQRWMQGGEGEIPLARSQAGRRVSPSAVPESIRSALENPLPGVRIGAVQELAMWLGSDDLSKVVMARLELTRVAEDDIPKVAAPARAALELQPHDTPTTAPELLQESPQTPGESSSPDGDESIHPVIDDLRAFEREYRSRLREYYGQQMTWLTERPTPPTSDLVVYGRELAQRLLSYHEGQLAALDAIVVPAKDSLQRELGGRGEDIYGFAVEYRRRLTEYFQLALERLREEMETFEESLVNNPERTRQILLDFLQAENGTVANE